MYETLKAEMARRNVNILDLSQATGIRYQTLSDKLRGKTKLTLTEAVKIKAALCLDMSIEELFGMQVAR